MNTELLVSSQVGIVSSFDALINTKFHDDVNAICWARNLSGDFKEIVSKLRLKENVTDVSIDELLQLQLSVNGCSARETILSDFKLLEELGASPFLNLIKFYPRDEDADLISTDVYSYHVDRSPIVADTFLCTYHGTASEIIPNNQVDQKILIPEIREKLKAFYNGPKANFDAFLEAHFFDLHYQPKTDATPINLGVGNLWKLAVDYPEQTVLPCVHRAPLENEGEYRLLMIC